MTIHMFTMGKLVTSSNFKFGTHFKYGLFYLTDATQRGMARITRSSLRFGVYVPWLCFTFSLF